MIKHRNHSPRTYHSHNRSDPDPHDMSGSDHTNNNRDHNRRKIKQILSKSHVLSALFPEYSRQTICRVRNDVDIDGDSRSDSSQDDCQNQERQAHSELIRRRQDSVKNRDKGAGQVTCRYL